MPNKIDKAKRIKDRCKICHREMSKWDMPYCLRCEKIRDDAYYESQESDN